MDVSKLKLSEGGGGGEEEDTDIDMEVKIYTAISKIDRLEWNKCCEEAAGKGKENPFLAWEFLNALEESGSASGASGWAPHHLVVHDKHSSRILACAPVYLKGHSYGEYVFDHSWARAYRTFSSDNYYPKLQCCVPFTPVMGPRLMARGETEEEARRARRALARGMVELCSKYGLSSAHVTFPTKEDWELMGRQGFLLRTGIQYHWRNEGYQSFDEFLMRLKQSRRKSIRQERNKVAKAGVRVKALTGEEIEERHWDAFYQFYLNTVDEKWGQAYLNRKFFTLLGREMANKVLLVVAEEEETGELVAGALNLIGGDCLYGRNWGCSKKYDSLHFELCYYQAIDAAIRMGLQRVEAGAQGEHKISRGYLPTFTYSAHFIRVPNFRNAVNQALVQERDQIIYASAMLTLQESPYKEGAEQHLESQGIRIQKSQ